MRTIPRVNVLVVAFLAAFAGLASAGQKPASPRAGEEIIVTQSASGDVLQGRLVELSPTTMALLVKGQRVDVPIENVLRIDIRGDSLKNGAIIGGAILGGLTGLACAELDSSGECAGALLFNTGFGVLAGIGIDALHKGRTPIYIKAGKAESSLQVKIHF